MDIGLYFQVKIYELRRKYRLERDGFPDITGFHYPLRERSYISSGFGERIHPITGKKEMHYGVDLPGLVGEQVMNIAPGKVIKVSYSERAGKYVKILHRTGKGEYLVSYYMHLNKIYVKRDEILNEAGVAIGEMGNTGWSTGPHLYFALRTIKIKGSEIYYGEPIDPTPYLREQGGSQFLADFGPVNFDLETQIVMAYLKE